MAVVEDQYVFMTWRKIADELAEALRLTREYVGEDSLPNLPGWDHFDALQKYRALVEDDKQSNLIFHARQELEIAGWYLPGESGDQNCAESLVAAVSEFSHYGHSGGSAPIVTNILRDLLMFKPLSPITSDSEYWMDVAEYMDGTAMWQCTRDGRLFSYDQGKTWHSIDDPRWRRKWSPLAWLWRKRINKMRDKPMRISEEDNHE